MREKHAWSLLVSFNKLAFYYVGYEHFYVLS